MPNNKYKEGEYVILDGKKHLVIDYKMTRTGYLYYLQGIKGLIHERRLKEDDGNDDQRKMRKMRI